MLVHGSTPAGMRVGCAHVRVRANECQLAHVRAAADDCACARMWMRAMRKFRVVRQVIVEIGHCGMLGARFRVDLERWSWRRKAREWRVRAAWVRMPHQSTVSRRGVVQGEERVRCSPWWRARCVRWLVYLVEEAADARRRAEDLE